MDKINSVDAYISWIKTINIETFRIKNWFADKKYMRTFYDDSANTLVSQEETWWAKREVARMISGIYSVSSVLAWLNDTFPIFAHVSVEEPTLVAFTPSAEAGIADKQVRLSLGKLLVKMLPFLTDNQVQTLIAQHESEINPNLVFISGPELTRHYIEEFEGTAACMSANKWSVHPTVAYHTDEIQLVCIKKGKTVTARTLVRHKPDGKKVFIRNYGSKTLQTVLNRMGYEVGNWIGTVFNTVVLRKGSLTRVATPYLDSDGRRGDVTTTQLALIDDKLTCVSPTVAMALAKEYPDKSTVASGVTATGYVDLYPVSSAAFDKTCAITGITVSVITNPNTEFVPTILNNKSAIALKKAVPDYFHRVNVLGTNDYIYVHSDDIVLVDTKRVYCTVPNLKKLGYAQLDKTLYPEDNPVHKGWYKQNCVIDTKGRNVLNVDTHVVISKPEKEINYVYVHTSDFKAKDYIKVHGDYYCTKESKYKVTNTGRKVIEGLHTFYTLFNGEIQIRKPKCHIRYFGVDYLGNDQLALNAWFEKNREGIFYAQVALRNVSATFLDDLSFGNPSRRYVSYNGTNYDRYYNERAIAQLPFKDRINVLSMFYERTSMTYRALQALLADATAKDYN